jgi:hypothetical protein
MQNEQKKHDNNRTRRARLDKPHLYPSERTSLLVPRDVVPDDSSFGLFSRQDRRFPVFIDESDFFSPFDRLDRLLTGDDHGRW